MKYSKATNYALHTMLFLAVATPKKHVGVHQLAENQEVSTTYLSKILTKLVKAGMVESISGANGGYKLKPDWESISFLDIIQAIEGPTSLFDYCIDHNLECLIQKVMISAEEKMLNELKHQKIVDIAKQMAVAP
ncbi:Rrf2 family transcriptional regulator [Paenibacillus crassostreae]|uniref:Rrf2 family transcriptional regulator n=1 Tax=Paenibacillus crassostreae TaxID=1763538 RepID=A0A167BCU8_9BACL|nr:Rrf2 family transcriptional regulator [Paenibacillus crassostreae]AOZ92959.1 transcriptional regulator [Paenibacillus crassostreae]OAB71952.1 Rrf2 family transcriptional regulator [Paenibacillus crassostreae]